MSSSGVKELATKYIIVLFSLLALVITAGLVRLWVDKSRLNKHEIDIQQQNAKRCSFRQEVNEQHLQEADLFGVRALEAGFFGGVAQSQLTSRASSPIQSSNSSSSTTSLIGTVSGSINMVNEPSCPPQAVSPSPSRRHRKSLRHISSIESPRLRAKSPLSRTPITADEELPPLPALSRDKSNIDVRPAAHSIRTTPTSSLRATQEEHRPEVDVRSKGMQCYGDIRIESSSLRERAYSVDSNRSFDTISTYQSSLKSYQNDKQPLFAKNKAGEQVYRDTTWQWPSPCVKQGVDCTKKQMLLREKHVKLKTNRPDEIRYVSNTSLSGDARRGKLKNPVELNDNQIDSKLEDVRASRASKWMPQHYAPSTQSGLALPDYTQQATSLAKCKLHNLRFKEPDVHASQNPNNEKSDPERLAVRIGPTNCRPIVELEERVISALRNHKVRVRVPSGLFSPQSAANTNLALIEPFSYSKDPSNSSFQI